MGTGVPFLRANPGNLAPSNNLFSIAPLPGDELYSFLSLGDLLGVPDVDGPGLVGVLAGDDGGALAGDEGGALAGVEVAEGGGIWPEVFKPDATPSVEESTCDSPMPESFGPEVVAVATEVPGVGLVAGWLPGVDPECSSAGAEPAEISISLVGGFS